MSVIAYPCYFLLLLLCLSLHACNARPLADINNNPEKKFHMKTNQNDQKEISVTAVPTVESASSKEFVAGKKDGIAKTRLGDNGQKLKDSKAKQKLDSVDEIEKNPGDAKNEYSLVSATWRVPQKKRGERHPGFNLDYSPPKTHPPSHN